VTAWHESDLSIPQNVLTQKVTVAAGGAATADFSFKAK
jgi:hypothetical protein